ncbi:hypothetical protein NQZ68_008818 [Dissostichus eleginoides]|nr:hypothetical protein NQZ68_008818 [Dissostichus eleginoides]
MNYEKGRLAERKSASSEKEQQQPDPVTNEVEATAPSPAPAPAPPVYPDLSSLKNPPPYEPLSQNNPLLPCPPKAIQAPQFKVKSGYLEMEESTQQPLLEAVKTLSSVTTSALNDLQRSNEHMISMANRLSTLEDSLMLNRLPSPVVTQNETIAPDNYVSAQRLDVQDSRRDTINPEDMEELKRQLDRISKDIKEKRSTPTCNPPPRDPEENYDRTLETCSSPKATSTPGVCQEIPYCMEEDPENWAPTQTSAFTGVIEGTIHPTIPENTSRSSPISKRLRSRGAKHSEVPTIGNVQLRIAHTGQHVYQPFAHRDVDALIGKLPPLSAGANAWINAVERHTAGETLCLGDIKVLVTRCEGLHACNQFLDTAQVANRVDTLPLSQCRTAMWAA